MFSRAYIAFSLLIFFVFTNDEKRLTLVKEVEVCVSKYQKCLTTIHDPNEGICYQNYLKCTDKAKIQVSRTDGQELHTSTNNFSNVLMAETEVAVKKAEANRIQELLNFRMQFMKSRLSPLVSHLVKSEEAVRKFETLQATVEDFLWLTNITRLQNPDGTSDLIRNVDQNFVEKILTTPFDIWYGGVGGAIGKVFDRVFVAVLCPSSEKRINQAFAKYADGSDGQARKLVNDLMKIANNSRERITCGLYVSAVQASMSRTGKKSYGLRTIPLTDQMIQRDQLLGTSYQNNQDGLLELPEAQRSLYDCDSIQRQISACQDTKKSCHKDSLKKLEECEAEFANCHNDIETSNEECFRLLGQTEYTVWHFLTNPAKLIGILFLIYSFIHGFFHMCKDIWKLLKWIKEIRAANINTPPAANTEDQPKPIQEIQPTAQSGNNQNQDLTAGNAVERGTYPEIPSVHIDNNLNTLQDSARAVGAGEEDLLLYQNRV